MRIMRERSMLVVWTLALLVSAFMGVSSAEMIPCGLVYANSARTLCCGGLVYIRSGAQPACCGNIGYDARHYMCCGGKSIVRKNGPSPRCCQEKGYDPRKETCVEGYVHKRTELGSECCQTPAGWTCCSKGRGCCNRDDDDGSGALEIPGFRPMCCDSIGTSAKAECCASAMEQSGVLPSCCNHDSVKPICCGGYNGKPLECCSAVEGYCCGYGDTYTSPPLPGWPKRNEIPAVPANPAIDYTPRYSHQPVRPTRAPVPVGVKRPQCCNGLYRMSCCATYYARPGCCVVRRNGGSSSSSRRTNVVQRTQPKQQVVQRRRYYTKPSRCCQQRTITFRRPQCCSSSWYRPSCCWSSARWGLCCSTRSSSSSSSWSSGSYTSSLSSTQATQRQNYPQITWRPQRPDPTPARPLPQRTGPPTTPQPTTTITPVGRRTPAPYIPPYTYDPNRGDLVPDELLYPQSSGSIDGTGLPEQQELAAKPQPGKQYPWKPQSANRKVIEDEDQEGSGESLEEFGFNQNNNDEGVNYEDYGSAFYEDYSGDETVFTVDVENNSGDENIFTTDFDGDSDSENRIPEVLPDSNFDGGNRIPGLVPDDNHNVGNHIPGLVPDDNHNVGNHIPGVVSNGNTGNHIPGASNGNVGNHIPNVVSSGNVGNHIPGVSNGNVGNHIPAVVSNSNHNVGNHIPGVVRDNNLPNRVGYGSPTSNRIITEDIRSCCGHVQVVYCCLDMYKRWSIQASCCALKNIPSEGIPLTYPLGSKPNHSSQPLYLPNSQTSTTYQALGNTNHARSYISNSQYPSSQYSNSQYPSSQYSSSQRQYQGGYRVQAKQYPQSTQYYRKTTTKYFPSSSSSSTSSRSYRGYQSGYQSSYHSDPSLYNRQSTLYRTTSHNQPTSYYPSQNYQRSRSYQQQPTYLKNYAASGYQSDQSYQRYNTKAPPRAVPKPQHVTSSFNSCGIYDSLRYICCDGTLRMKKGLLPKCCKRNIYDASVHFCCANGQIQKSCDANYKPEREKQFWKLFLK